MFYKYTNHRFSTHQFMLRTRRLNSYIRFRASNIFFNSTLILTAGLTMFFIVLLKSMTAVDFMIDPLIFTYTIFVTTFQLSRVLGAMFHKKSLKGITMDDIIDEEVPYEPKVTFVIPCKNEEKVIEKTIIKCYEADYPKEKIEVIVINDGSTDGTLDVLKKVKKAHKNLVIVNWRKNRGKRHGMAEGIKRATGEIIIQLDSDSYIKPKTFRNLINSFKNPKIGVVCAHTRPDNADENLLTKIQTAYYFISFRILKAAESTFLKVFCCSGCCSAYRKSVIRPIVNKWLKEKFLGLPVTWGDDRALTNWALRLNYFTIFSDDVEAYTVVPNSFKHFLKQQIRWKKGWFVNSVFASRFIMKKDPFVAFTYFFPLIFITFITPFMAIRGLIYNPLVRGLSPLYYILGVFLVSAGITTYYRYLEREDKYWLYVFVWSAINMFVLSFVLFYALFTIQNRKWGTR